MRFLHYHSAIGLVVFCTFGANHSTFASNTGLYISDFKYSDKPLAFKAQTGFTGLLRSPVAHVENLGNINFSLAHEDNINYNSGYIHGAHNTALLSLGLLPNLELTIQNAFKKFKGDAGVFGSAGSDLAFSAKWRLPIAFDKLPLDFAVGVKDIGTHSDATRHQNYYSVASWQSTGWDLTLGYGKGDELNQMGRDYLDGVFGGGRWLVHKHVAAVADYDGTGVNWGVQWSLPESWTPKGWRLQGSWQIASNSRTQGRDNQWWSLSLSKALVSQSRAYTSRHSQSMVDEQSFSANLSTVSELSVKKIQSPLPQFGVLSLSKKETLRPVAFSDQIKVTNQVSGFNSTLVTQSLTELGYENLRVGFFQQQPVIAFENNIYLKNELKAIGEVIGVVGAHHEGDFTLILQNRQLPVLAVSSSGHQIQQAIRGGPVLTPWFQVQSTSQLRQLWRNVEWSEGRRRRLSFGLPRISFAPVQDSSLGTDWGVLDYTFGLSTNLTMDLWPGAVVDIRHLNEVYSSDDVGFPNHPVAPIRDGVDRILLHQSFSLPLGVMTQFSLGQVYYDYQAIINETRWESANGRHRFGLLTAYLENDQSSQNINSINSEQQESALLSYRYRWPNWGVDTEITAGRYRFGDRGISLKSHHWFDDTKITLEVKRNENHTFAGMIFELPLTFGRSSKPSVIQLLGGINAWRWGYQTQLSGELNYIVPNQFEVPWLQHNLDSVYFDRDRLSRQYMIENQYVLLEGVFRGFNCCSNQPF